jgi:predicted ABC-type sugar transport system permease subunit
MSGPLKTQTRLIPIVVGCAATLAAFIVNRVVDLPSLPKAILAGLAAGVVVGLYAYLSRERPA